MSFHYHTKGSQHHWKHILIHKDHILSCTKLACLVLNVRWVLSIKHFSIHSRQVGFYWCSMFFVVLFFPPFFFSFCDWLVSMNIEVSFSSSATCFYSMLCLKAPIYFCCFVTCDWYSFGSNFATDSQASFSLNGGLLDSTMWYVYTQLCFGLLSLSCNLNQFSDFRILYCRHSVNCHYFQ